jgi:hypothetical protein
MEIMPFVLNNICHTTFAICKHGPRILVILSTTFCILSIIFFLTHIYAWRILVNTCIATLPEETSVNDSRKQQSKQENLRKHCCLNPHPHTVRDELFGSDDFFDPCDLTQVKYEMLRRVVHDKSPVSKSAADFGFSRVSFYQMRDAFQNEGLSGLLPRKRGPKGRHKPTGEVMSLVNEARASKESIGPVFLAQRIKERFGTRIHPRSIQRAVAAQKKKLHDRHGKTGDAA